MIYNFFLAFTFFVQQTVASPMACVEIFPKLSEHSVQAQIDKNYYYNQNYSSYVHKLQQQGVQFKFWDPSDGGRISLKHLYTEPVIEAIHRDGKFLVESIVITLPVEPSSLFGTSGTIHNLRKTLAKVDRVIQLQNEGVQFSPTSLLHGQSVSILGIERSTNLSDSTLVSIQILLETLGFKGITFESNESVWDRLGFLPDTKIVTDPSDKTRLLLRSYYFERPDYWEQLTYDIDARIFRFHGFSLLRPPGFPLQ